VRSHDYYYYHQRYYHQSYYTEDSEVVSGKTAAEI